MNHFPLPAHCSIFLRKTAPAFFMSGKFLILHSCYKDTNLLLIFHQIVEYFKKK